MSLMGQYKTAGGKLVSVEFEIVDDRMTDVAVHGDFFLFPEEALGPIVAAIEGAPTTLSEAALTARISMAMPPGTEWLGASPMALAIAVRRALAPDHDAIPQPK